MNSTPARSRVCWTASRSGGRSPALPPRSRSPRPVTRPRHGPRACVIASRRARLGIGPKQRLLRGSRRNAPCGQESYLTRRLRDHPRALAQRQTGAGILFDGAMEVDMAYYDECGAGHDRHTSIQPGKGGLPRITALPEDAVLRTTAANAVAA